MQKKKILIINWQDIKNPLSGGAEVHLFEIFRRLTEYYEIHLLCDHFNNTEKEEILDGIHIHRIGKRNTFNFYVPYAYKELDRRYNFDLVIEDLNKIPFYGSLYIPKKRIAILHHFFGNVIFQETNFLFGSYVYINERMVPRLYKDIDFICVSEGTKKELVKYGIQKERVRVIYNGVNLSKFRTFKKSDFPLFTAVGRIKRYKRFDLLINAVELAYREGAFFRLVIIGDGDDKERLKKITEKKGLKDRITFTGYLIEDEKIKIVGSSWAHINTSPKEGWGLTSIEAQASGTLSIVPDSPGLNETVIDEKTGFIYEFGDVNELKEILIRISNEKNLAENMGKNARHFASNFSWDRSAKQMKKFIDEKISRSF